MLNLYDLYKRSSPHMRADAGVVDARREFNGSRQLGFDLPPGASISLLGLQDLKPLQSFPNSTGWVLFSSSPREEPFNARVVLRESHSGVEVDVREFAVSSTSPAIVPIPWPAVSTHKQPLFDLSVEADARNAGGVFLSVTPLQDRQDLIRLCKGVGVEIGPGVNPQVLTAPDVDVTYCDEMDRAEWEQAYAYKKHTWEARTSATPWHLYRKASGDALPVEDCSLDFIFASHVFEHLVNPLRHIEHWLAKLKPGGLIVAIVPHAECSVDYARPLSTLPEIIAEYEGPMRPGREHYAKFFGEKDADRRLRERRSFHAHFYTAETLGVVLSHAAAHHGLDWYQIEHRGNYQEIFFVAGKAPAN